MGLEVENLDDVYVQFERNELADCKQVLESLVSGGELVMLTPQLCIERRIYEDIWEKTKQHFAEHGELTLAEFRDMLGTSRKYANTTTKTRFSKRTAMCAIRGRSSE